MIKKKLVKKFELLANIVRLNTIVKQKRMKLVLCGLTLTSAVSIPTIPLKIQSKVYFPFNIMVKISELVMLVLLITNVMQ